MSAERLSVGRWADRAENHLRIARECAEDGSRGNCSVTDRQVVARVGTGIGYALLAGVEALRDIASAIRGGGR
jgi:hypothetical protein